MSMKCGKGVVAEQARIVLSGSITRMLIMCTIIPIIIPSHTGVHAKEYLPLGNPERNCYCGFGRWFWAVVLGGGFGRWFLAVVLGGGFWRR